MKNSNMKNYLKMAVLCIATVAFYQIIYLRWTFYDGLFELSGLNNTQFAMEMSLFGIGGFLFNIPGGYIADKIQPRKLISLSLLINGAGAILLTLQPGFIVQMAIYTAMAVASNLFFWTALMKAVRMLETKDGEGKMFGILEGSRGLITTVISFIFIYFYGQFASAIGGIKMVLIGYAVLSLASAVILYFILADGELNSGVKDDSNSIKLADLKILIKNPVTWLVSLVVISCYSVHIGSTYITPYLTNIIGISASIAAILAVFRNYILQAAGGLPSGFIAAKVGSTTKVIRVAFIVMGIGTVILALLPATSGMAVVLAIDMILVCGTIYVVRGIYFATIGEAGIPMKLMGSAVGIVSFIGFTPDIFLTPLCGMLLDNYEGATGYRIIFMMMVGFAVIGIISAAILVQMHKKNLAAQK